MSTGGIIVTLLGAIIGGMWVITQKLERIIDKPTRPRGPGGNDAVVYNLEQLREQLSRIERRLERIEQRP